MKIISKILITTILSLLCFSCSTEENEKTISDYESSEPLKKELQVLNSPTPIGEDIVLPKGTVWKYSDRAHNGVEFELPEGYKFLLFNRRTGEATISVGGGGYSCTCSGSGGCTTFYNKDSGYGCLHSSCTGSCSGNNSRVGSKSTIEGVLYVLDYEMSSKPLENSSLSPKGKELVFELPAVQKEIKRVYDLLYKGQEKPNVDFEKLNEEEYVFAKTYAYGVEMALVAPNNSNLNKMMPGVSTVSISDAPTSCGCSGEGSNCALKKKGAFGYVAYFCSGCTTCTMR